MTMSAEITPTADAGYTAPESGTAPAANESPAPQTTSTPQPQTRTYTQAEMDKAAAWYRKSLREEAARIEREYQSRTQPTATEQVDPVTQDLQSLKFQMTEFQLDRAISDLGKRYPELTNEAQLREVLGVVVDRGLDRVTHLSIPDVLDLAYRYWKAEQTAAEPPVDVEAIKKQAADEAIKKYTDRKVATANSTPRTEGTGGTAAVTPQKKRTRRDLDSMLESAIARME